MFWIFCKKIISIRSFKINSLDCIKKSNIGHMEESNFYTCIIYFSDNNKVMYALISVVVCNRLQYAKVNHDEVLFLFALNYLLHAMILL